MSDEFPLRPEVTMERLKPAPPAIRISIAPAPMVNVMNPEWAEQARKLQDVHHAAPQLLAALKAMTAMHAKMMAKVNHGASFYDAETIAAMNDAPIIANAALRLAGELP